MLVPVSEDLEILLCKNLLFDNFQVLEERKLKNNGGLLSAIFKKNPLSASN